jgi:hypothetical protein
LFNFTQNREMTAVGSSKNAFVRVWYRKWKFERLNIGICS